MSCLWQKWNHFSHLQLIYIYCFLSIFWPFLFSGQFCNVLLAELHSDIWEDFIWSRSPSFFSFMSFFCLRFPVPTQSWPKRVSAFNHMLQGEESKITNIIRGIAWNPFIASTKKRIYMRETHTPVWAGGRKKVLHLTGSPQLSAKT